MSKEIIIKEIKIPHHNRSVNAILYTPNAKQKSPIVIFSHGYNGCKSDFDAHARYLVENNIAALCYDFCGGSTRDTSGMLTTDMTLFTEVEDLEAVIAAVKCRANIDSDNIFVFGGSQGGLVTAMTVDDRSEDVRGMILLYPAFCIPDDWNRRFPKDTDIPKEEELWGMKLGRVFFESIRGYDVFENVGKYKNAVLVLHGDKDPIVALGYSERLEKTYDKVSLTVFPGEGHGFTPEGDRKVMEMVCDFVEAERV